MCPVSLIAEHGQVCSELGLATYSSDFEAKTETQSPDHTHDLFRWVADAWLLYCGGSSAV